LAAGARPSDGFLRKYPRSPHRREAQEARAELALLQNHEAAGTASVAAAPPKSALRGDELDDSGLRGSATTESPARSSGKTRASEGVRSSSAETNDAAATPKPEVSDVEDVSAATTPEFTRVTIQLEDRVEYSSARIGNPERIFFDLHTAKLTPQAAKKAIH